MMMSLGMFQFSLATAAYQELQRHTAWRHAQNSRIGVRPANQFLGPGEDTVSLQGIIAPPITGDRKSLDTLRQLGDTGAPLALVDGVGKVYGAFVIQSLEEHQSIFFADGTARRLEFTLDLLAVDPPSQAQAQTAAPASSSSSAAPATTSTSSAASATSTNSSEEDAGGDDDSEDGES